SSTTGYNDWGRRPTIKRNLRRVMNLGDGRVCYQDIIAEDYDDEG
ncbi:MAG: hypothetical protein EZS28_015925, partial [Streblomastix strix]